MQTTNVINSTPLVLSSATVKLLDAALSGEFSGRGKWKKAADAIIADGVHSSMLIKPARGEANPYEALHFQINGLIVSHFSDHVQKLIPKEPKVLSDVDKDTRRYWMQQIGTMFGLIRKYVVQAEAEPKDTSPRVPKTKVQMAREYYQKGDEKLQSIENPTFDVAGFLKEHKALIAKYIPKA